jgi:hypothetical protein
MIQVVNVDGMDDVSHETPHEIWVPVIPLTS